MVECSLLQFEKVNLGKELFATSLVATVVFRKISSSGAPGKRVVYD